MRVKRAVGNVDYGRERGRLLVQHRPELLPVEGAPGARVQAQQPPHAHIVARLCRPILAKDPRFVSWSRSAAAPSDVRRYGLRRSSAGSGSIRPWCSRRLSAAAAPSAALPRGPPRARGAPCACGARRAPHERPHGPRARAARSARRLCPVQRRASAPRPPASLLRRTHVLLSEPF